MKLKNFKISINRISKTDKEYWRKFFKLKSEPVWFMIDIPKEHECTLGLLTYKMNKDLNVHHFGDVDYFVEKELLPYVRKYVRKFYDGYLKV